MDRNARGARRDWQEFEREVANLYRLLGALVHQNTALAGNQIDIVLHERATTGTTIVTAVECKAYSRPLGVDVVNTFGGLAYLLRQRRLIDRAAIVAANGFTPTARSAADAHAIELIDIADLEQKVRERRGSIADVPPAIAEPTHQSSPQHPKRAFVVIPFAPEFEDIYILGIRDVAEKLGIVVERADSVEHNGEIVHVVQEKIKAADVVIADTTGRNANVFYEIGYSHAAGRPTVLIARKGEALPFDVQSINFILYENIVQLRDRLERRLRDTLATEAAT